MSVLELAGAVLVLALMFYLFVALLHPERF
jgi:K+-transporting ATPase KdpF subunit